MSIEHGRVSAEMLAELRRLMEDPALAPLLWAEHDQSIVDSGRCVVAMHVAREKRRLIVAAVNALPALLDEIETRGRERDGFAEMSRDAVRVCNKPGCTAANIRADDGSRYCAAGHETRWVERLEMDTLRALLDTSRWEDRPTEHDDAIATAGPWADGDHERYGRALAMVEARRSKYALVDLVNWLLARAEAPR